MKKTASLTIAMAASEALPYAKSGGLADVVGALPGQLARLGHRVLLFVPYYRETRARFPHLPRAHQPLDLPFPGHDVRVEILRHEPAPGVSVLLVRENAAFDRPYLYGNPDGAWHARGGEVQPIRTRTGVGLKDATIGTTAPELYRTERDKASFGRLSQAARLTRFGGDAYFYAVVAAGHLDIALDAGLQPYDIAPLLPIILGAGGAAAEWTGGNPAEGGNVITAGSEALLEEALAVMA